jgi:16S rRNA (cytosine1402-N4)-methyltransferase
VRKDGIYLDATCGRGGHTEAIVRQLTTGKVIVFDLDIVAIEEAKKRLAPYLEKLIFINDNYATLKKHCEENDITLLDGFVFDLGVSSPQFDDPSRGFSYRYDAKLDMRMDQSQTFSAYHLVNEYPLNQLTKILRDYGEEPFAYPIAKKIVAARLLAPITTTGAGRHHQVRSTLQNSSSKGPSRQTNVSGDPHRGQSGIGQCGKSGQ